MQPLTPDYVLELALLQASSMQRAALALRIQKAQTGK